jgi:hypothetical protein
MCKERSWYMRLLRVAVASTLAVFRSEPASFGFNLPHTVSYGRSHARPHTVSYGLVQPQPRPTSYGHRHARSRTASYRLNLPRPTAATSSLVPPHADLIRSDQYHAGSDQDLTLLQGHSSHLGLALPLKPFLNIVFFSENSTLKTIDGFAGTFVESDPNGFRFSNFLRPSPAMEPNSFRGADFR